MLRYDDPVGAGFVSARQGRYTHATLASAEHMLEALLTNNPPDKLALYGGAKALFVAFTACYGGHYDPAPMTLGSSPRYPASLTNRNSLRELVWALNNCRGDFED
jgi:hypothetical protein